MKRERRHTRVQQTPTESALKRLVDFDAHAALIAPIPPPRLFSPLSLPPWMLSDPFSLLSALLSWEFIGFWVSSLIADEFLGAEGGLGAAEGIEAFEDAGDHRGEMDRCVRWKNHPGFVCFLDFFYWLFWCMLTVWWNALMNDSCTGFFFLWYQVQNPATGDVIASVPCMGERETSDAISSAYEAFNCMYAHWRGGVVLLLSFVPHFL